MTNAPANTARTGRHLGADTFGWRVTFALVSVLTAVLMASMAVSLPRNSHPAKIGFLRQFRLFFDRRIQLGVADVVFGAAPPMSSTRIFRRSCATKSACPNAISASAW